MAEQVNIMRQPNALLPKRVLLKISGESLMGSSGFGIDPDVVKRIAEDIAAVHQRGIEICIVVGGGNIFRGPTGISLGIERVTGDYMGMLATVINALALHGALENLDIEARVQSAIPMETFCEPYIRRTALRHMEKGRVVIFAAGSGNPFFTTDTAAALRASEMSCDLLLKGTRVDGVYTADPLKDVKAKRYKTLSYKTVLQDDLKVMDAAAISLARENNIPIIVFSIEEKGAFAEVVAGKGRFTLVENNEVNSHDE